jgi:hypothetical protein
MKSHRATGITVPARISLWLMGVSAPCPCMGNAYGLIGIDSATMDRILEGIVVLLLGGSGYLIWQIRDLSCKWNNREGERTGGSEPVARNTA